MFQNFFKKALGAESAAFDAAASELQSLPPKELNAEAAKWHDATAIQKLENLLTPGAPDQRMRSAAARMLIMRSTRLPHEHS